MDKILKNVLLLSHVAAVFTSCDNFVFDNVHVDYNENPLESKGSVRNDADRYIDSLSKTEVSGQTNSPDPDGVFNGWATCLAIFKEGHSRGDGMMHGNFIYHNAPWKQEEFVIIRDSTAKWPTVEVRRQSTVTYLKQGDGKTGPDYTRIVGGRLKRWGLCLYFFNREGKLMSDDILDHSDEYQIFFTVSEVNDKGNPYGVVDCRGTWRPKKSKFGDWKKGGIVDTTPISSPLFANKTAWKERAELTPKIFEYTYRDTWIHNVMADGTCELFSQRLLPPLTREDADWAVAPYDQDRVGLKGHFNFDIDADENDALRQKWPLEITRHLDPATGETGRYIRPSYLLPKFYLSVRVMKCPKGKKALIPKDEYLSRHSTCAFRSLLVCSEAYNPDEPKEYGADSEWREFFRFNIPIKVFCGSFGTDFTTIDPNDPLYFYLGHEVGLSSLDALEASQNAQTRGIDGGPGFGNWFLQYGQRERTVSSLRKYLYVCNSQSTPLVAITPPTAHNDINTSGRKQMMKKEITTYLLPSLMLLGLNSCTRNEMSVKQSTSKTKLDHLIIKEVFYVGHYRYRDVCAWGMKNLNQMYNDDQYIAIFNPTDEMKYLDGSALCVNTIEPSKVIQFASKDDFVNCYYGASGISYFPGKGNNYPIKPGQIIIVARYTVDHKAKFEAELEDEDLSMYSGLNAFLDLSKADFEWIDNNYDPGQENSPNVPDMNAILTSTDVSGNIGPAYEFSHISESNGIALIKLSWTPEEFKKNYAETKDSKGYLHYITVTSSAFGNFYAIEMPFECVIDCITICPRRMFQMRPSKLDRGYNAVINVSFSSLGQSDYPISSGPALIRKWDGKKYVDDNNTTADFEVKVISLSRRDEKGNAIK